jgi:hypothetical protein
MVSQVHKPGWATSCGRSNDQAGPSMALSLNERILGQRAGRRRMHNSDFYREEAAKYRQLAEAASDAAAKQEFLELAAACEEVADHIDDCRASG